MLFYSPSLIPLLSVPSPHWCFSSHSPALMFSSLLLFPLHFQQQAPAFPYPCLQGGGEEARDPWKLRSWSFRVPPWAFSSSKGMVLIPPLCVFLFDLLFCLRKWAFCRLGGVGWRRRKLGKEGERHLSLLKPQILPELHIDCFRLCFFVWFLF